MACPHSRNSIVSPLQAERSRFNLGLLSWLHKRIGWFAGRMRPAQGYFLADLGVEESDALVCFDTWCAARQGIRARVLLGGALTHQFVLPESESQPLIGEALERFARQRFVQYYGDSAQAWPIQTWASKGRKDRHYGACTVQGVEMAALHRIAAVHRVGLTAIEPAWAALLRRLSQRSPGWAQDAAVGVVLVERACITWMRCSHGCLMEIHQRRLQGANWPALLERIQELRPRGCETMPVWLAGYGIAQGEPPQAADNLHVLNALELMSFPPELLN